jgi:hypothetical protein
MVSTESPQTREEIVDALTRQETESVAYWTTFDTDAFFARIGEAWSPAETVRHLTKSTRPVATALAAPSILLRLRFGKSKRPPLTYDALRARYQQKLAEGGKAGRFAPSERTSEDREGWRTEIMTDFARANHDLRKAIGRWSEKRLDRLQLPHPLLGKLTVREMLFFTLYHQRHHVGVVQRHLSERM